MTDIEILEFIYNRLEFVYDESPNTDFMRRFAEVIQGMHDKELDVPFQLGGEDK